MYQLTTIEKILLPLQRFIVELYNFGNMKMQIRDKNFKLIAERERPSKVKAPTTFIHTIRRIGDKPALTPFFKDFSL